MALISGGLKVFSLASVTTMPSDFGSFSTLYGTRSLLWRTSGSSKRRPMKRLIEKMVFSGLVIAWRLATCPTSRSPLLAKATTDGVIRPPSALLMTCGSPPSMTATTELVVPRSMPMILPMRSVLLRVVRDADQRRAQDPVVQAVAPLQLADHLVIGEFGGLLVDDRLVRVGRDVVEGPIEVVEHRQQLADQQRVGEAHRRAAVLFDSPAVVGQVGGRPLRGAKLLARGRSCLLELSVQILQLRNQRSARRAAAVPCLIGRRGAVGRVPIVTGLALAATHASPPWWLVISSFMSVAR